MKNLLNLINHNININFNNDELINLTEQKEFIRKTKKKEKKFSNHYNEEEYQDHRNPHFESYH